MEPGGNRSRARVAQRLQRASGRLSTAATSQMENDLPWVVQLPAEDRAYIGLIIQAGIKAFIDWFRSGHEHGPLRAEVFGKAPRALASEISLEQTVNMIRLSVDVVERNVEDVVGPEDAPIVLDALSRYARDLAFATAEVYARAAEQRGAWDARLEALVVDSVLRGEGGDGLASRAAALGWHGQGYVVALAGPMRNGQSRPDTLESVRRAAHEHGLDSLCAVQGDRLVVVLGGTDKQGRPIRDVVAAFPDGPVVVGPVVPDLEGAGLSASAALAGLRVATAWPGAPRPVPAQDLLVERALDGDRMARAELLEGVWRPLEEAGEPIRDTLAAYLDNGCSIEATGRALFVHPNTVRYRLKRAVEATGLDASEPRERYALQVAITLGRLADRDL